MGILALAADERVAEVATGTSLSYGAIGTLSRVEASLP